MQNFVQVELSTILQPFLQRIERLEGAEMNLEAALQEVQHGVVVNRGAIGDAAAAVVELRARSVAADRRSTAMQERIEEYEAKVQQAMQEFDASMVFLRETRARLDDDVEGLPAIRRRLDGLDGHVAESVEALRGMSSALGLELRRSTQDLGAALGGLRTDQEATAALVERLCEGLAEIGGTASEAKAVAERTEASVAGLTRKTDEVINREAQLASQINGWKEQWAKLHPNIERAHRDIGVLAERCDHFVAAIHGAQQAAASTSKSQGALHTELDKQRECLAALRAEHQQLNSGLGDLRGVLHDVSRLANGMHSEMEERAKVVMRNSDALRVLERAQQKVSEDVAKTASSVIELRRQNVEAVEQIESVNRAVGTTQEALSSTRLDVRNVAESVGGCKDEILRVKDGVAKLAMSVEFCHAGFAGLQQGLSATGASVQSRSSVAEQRKKDVLPAGSTLPSLSRLPGAASAGTSSTTSAPSRRGASSTQ